MKLSSYIRSSRAFVGISQNELAEATGISRITIGSIEDHEDCYDPRKSTIVKIAKYLVRKGAPPVSLHEIDVSKPSL